MVNNQRRVKILKLFKLVILYGQIKAEFQIVSPLVPKRQVKFLRYCEELRRGVWMIVDVTPTQEKLSYGGCSRLPSGLIIVDMANGYSKVMNPFL